MKKIYVLLLLLFPIFSFCQVTQQWMAKYASNGSGRARALVVDPNGNVYVTGQQIVDGSDDDYVTVKYDANGKVLWVKRYNGPGDRSDVATAIALDSFNNVYVTGSSTKETEDYTTVKYDSNGNELWVRRYNGPANRADIASSIAVDKQGDVFVTGKSFGDGTEYDYATIRYDKNGNEMWVNRYSGPGNSDDIPVGLALDAWGHVYVTGTAFISFDGYGDEANYDYLTIKYNTEGDQLWIKHYDGGLSGIDNASALAVDNTGNVYVTGASSNQLGGRDITSIKYDSTGQELWVKRLDEGKNPRARDVARDMAVDANGNLYVTGYGSSFGAVTDYLTIKYNNEGKLVWMKMYDGPANSVDIPFYLDLDVLGNVYVTGYSDGGKTSLDCATVKYDGNGNEIWAIKYNNSNFRENIPGALVVDKLGNVYTIVGDLNRNYATIKYVQQELPIKVERFTLVNAATDKDVQELKDGAQINLAAIRGGRLNIRANVTGIAGSVMMKLSGTSFHNKTENIAPYALFGNWEGNYASWTPMAGTYTLTATPYSEANGGGTAGTPVTITFTVVEQLTLSHFTLINARNSSVISKLENGAVVDLAKYPDINVRVNGGIGFAESVRFGLNSNANYRIENFVPYAIAADNKGAYYNWSATPGKYTITATPFTKDGAFGFKGTPLTITITIVDSRQHQSGIVQNKMAQPELAVSEGLTLNIYPNPTAGNSFTTYMVHRNTRITLALLDENARLLRLVYSGNADAGINYTKNLPLNGLASGTYMLRLITADGTMKLNKIIKR